MSPLIGLVQYGGSIRSVLMQTRERGSKSLDMLRTSFIDVPSLAFPHPSPDSLLGWAVAECKQQRIHHIQLGMGREGGRWDVDAMCIEGLRRFPSRLASAPLHATHLSFCKFAIEVSYGFFFWYNCSTCVSLMYENTIILFDNEIDITMCSPASFPLISGLFSVLPLSQVNP